MLFLLSSWLFGYQTSATYGTVATRSRYLPIPRLPAPAAILATEEDYAGLAQTASVDEARIALRHRHHRDALEEPLTDRLPALPAVVAFEHPAVCRGVEGVRLLPVLGDRHRHAARDVSYLSPALSAVGTPQEAVLSGQIEGVRLPRIHQDRSHNGYLG